MELKGKLLTVEISPLRWKSVSDFIREGAPVLYRELARHGVFLGTAGTVIDKDNFIVKFPIVRADTSNPVLAQYIQRIGEPIHELSEVLTSAAIIIGAITLLVTSPSLVRIFQSIGASVKGITDVAGGAVDVLKTSVEALKNPLVLAGVVFSIFLITGGTKLFRRK